MKGGMRANGLIAPKTAGTAGKTNSTAGRTAGTAGKIAKTAGKIAGTAARINGIGSKTDGIAKKICANLKGIDRSTETMNPAGKEGPVFAKASPWQARRR